MLTEKDLDETREQERLRAETYLRGLVDYIKWTSTVGIAAILWIGSVVSSIAGLSRVLAVVSLVVLLVSLVVAVLAVKRVLNAWATEWNVAREDSAFVLLKKLKSIKESRVSEQKEEERIDRLIQAIEASKAFARPARFNTWVSWHISLLIVGVLLYVFAQLLAML